jgi:hypothetical protein
MNELGDVEYQLYWAGWIIQDLVTIEDESQPYMYAITAADGLGRLANIDYTANNDVPAGLTRVSDLIGNCLAFAGTDDLWPTGRSVPWKRRSIGGKHRRKRIPQQKTHCKNTPLIFVFLNPKTTTETRYIQRHTTSSKNCASHTAHEFTSRTDVGCSNNM